MYKVTIAELFSSNEVNSEKSTVEQIRHEQAVDTLDLKAVIDAVNRVPLQPFAGPADDAGKPRRQDDAARSMDNPQPVEADPFG